mmetsp:Transcript_56701/g.156951  ORF Transcript_56701/g.156951 Transcript_56701/m.156951 type:complete len:278 (-) Transcript_56701:119-952(-)
MGKSECFVPILGQKEKYLGGHICLQKERPAELTCMGEAEYEELRRAIDKHLAPVNDVITRTSRNLRLCRTSPRVCALASSLSLLPAAALAFLPPWPEEVQRWMPMGLILLGVALALNFGVMQFLRVGGEGRIDRASDNAFKDVWRACREASREKPFTVEVRSQRRRGLWYKEESSDYYLRITWAKGFVSEKSETVGSEPSTGVRLPYELEITGPYESEITMVPAAAAERETGPYESEITVEVLPAIDAEAPSTAQQPSVGAAALAQEGESDGSGFEC